MTHEKIPALRRHYFDVIPVIALSTALLLIVTSVGCTSGGEREERASFLTAMTAERLHYQARAELVSDELKDPAVEVHLEARHHGSHPINIDYDLCGVRIALYRDAAARELAWKAPLGSATWIVDQAGPPAAGACGELRRVTTIDLGERFSPPEFRARYPISGILGDSLEAGWYYAVLELDVREGTSVAMRIAAGWLFIPDDLQPVGRLTARGEKSIWAASLAGACPSPGPTGPSSVAS